MKKIVSIEVLHLEDIGYGPEGLLTRKEWRKECLEKYQEGDSAFLNWQDSWYLLAQKNHRQLHFSIIVKFENGMIQKRECFTYSHALDFSAIDMNFRKHTKDIFLVTALFNSTSFINPICLVGITFKQKIVFDYAFFSSEIRFDRIIFNKGVSFNNATFANKAWFAEAKFLQSGDFINAIFNNFVSFDSAVFTLGASFQNVKFIGSAWFKKAVFEWDARFDRAMFESSALFNSAIFKTIAGFSETTFSSKETSFVKTHFESESWFQNAKFLETSTFENAVFNNVGHFENAKFNFSNSKISSFRGCQIDKTRLEFSDESHFSQNDFSDEAIKNISFLKRLSDEHGQLDQALNFNAMELRSKRKSTWQTLQSEKTFLNLFPFLPWQLLVRASFLTEGKLWFCFFTYLYEHVSDFGRSFTRPLYYLILLFFVSYLFAIISAFESRNIYLNYKRQPIFSELSRIYTYPKNEVKISAYRAATEYSLYRTSNFLDFTDSDKKTETVTLRLFASTIEPWWARLFGIIKGILSAVLLFLFALGLRNKYRVG